MKMYLVEFEDYKLITQEELLKRKTNTLINAKGEMKKIDIDKCKISSYYLKRKAQSED